MPDPSAPGPSHSRTFKVVLAASAAVAAASLLAACGGGTAADNQSPTATSSKSASPTASPTPSGVPIDFETTLISSYSSIDKVGDDQSYGLNALSGTTEVNDRSVRVKLLSTVDYSDGSGPLGGFMQLSWSDGSTLGLRVDGEASYDGASKDTDYQGNLTVINGSDTAKGITGSGTMTGTREGTSTSIKIKVKLYLQNAPEEITGKPNSSSKSPSSSYSATIEP